MYFPYVRSYYPDVDALKERVDMICNSGFVPIIEPYERVYGHIVDVLKRFDQVGAESILITNPNASSISPSADDIAHVLGEHCSRLDSVGVGVCITDGMPVEEILARCARFDGRRLAIVHSGFREAAALAPRLRELYPDCTHIFHERSASRSYRNRFDFGRRVLIRDGRKPLMRISIGFHRYKLPTLPQSEFFSDLHTTYLDEGVSHFGDWTNRGDEIANMDDSTFGNTFYLPRIDPDHNGDMYLNRFEPRERPLPRDEALEQALAKLVDGDEGAPFRDRPTQAIAELVDMHRTGFRSLTRIEKHSIAHHFDSMARFFANGAK